MTNFEIHKMIRLLRTNVNLPINIVMQKVGLLFNIYKHNRIILSAEEVVFYRAIKYTAPPESLKQLSYPPSEITKLGRANFNNQPVFYCSGNPKAVFSELDVNSGDLVVLSKWKLKKDAVFSLLGYSDENFETLNASRNCPRLITSVQNVNSSNSNKKIHKFFIDSFVSNNYNLSASIASFFLPKNIESGLIYPAIAVKANAENCALNTAMADRNLQFINAKWYRIDNIQGSDPRTYTMTCLSCSDSFDATGRLYWREPTQHEKAYIYDNCSL